MGSAGFLDAGVEPDVVGIDEREQLLPRRHQFPGAHELLGHEDRQDRLW